MKLDRTGRYVFVCAVVVVALELLAGCANRPSLSATCAGQHPQFAAYADCISQTVATGPWSDTARHYALTIKMLAEEVQSGSRTDLQAFQAASASLLELKSIEAARRDADIAAFQRVQGNASNSFYQQQQLDLQRQQMQWNVIQSQRPMTCTTFGNTTTCN